MKPPTLRVLWVATLVLVAIATRIAPVEAAALGTAITYQGHLIHQGQPANGQFDFEFRLYDAAAGGAAVGQQVAQTLQVNGGLFTTVLDLGNPFDGQKLWLEIRVKPNGGPGQVQALAPRTEMTAVPSALDLKLPWSRTVNEPGNVLDLKNTGAGSALRITANVVSPNSGLRVYNNGTGSGIEVSTQCNIKSEAAVKIFNSGKGMAYYGESKVGRPARPDVERAPDISPEQFAAGGSESYSAATPAVIGDGPLGAASADSGYIPPGVASIFVGDIGAWGYGVDSVGVIGQCPHGVGLFGTTDSLSGATNPNPNAIGVRGYSAYGAGVSGETQYGSAVRGTALSGGSYAGYFEGAVHVVGTLTATDKQFLIDHPLDPEHRRLAHASIESAEMLNLYRGNVTLGPDGFAVVTLPTWFEALNGDFSFQLTPIGEAAPGLYIADEIHLCKFRIGGGPPGARVSWMVTGVRHDRYSREHPLQVEQIKPESFAGAAAPGLPGGKP